MLRLLLRATPGALLSLAMGGCAYPSNVVNDIQHMGDPAYDACRRNADPMSNYGARCAQEAGSGGQTQQAAQTRPMATIAPPPPPAPANSLPSGQPAVTVYDSQVHAHFDPDSHVKTGAAEASCAQLMHHLSQRYGRGAICNAIIQNGVDMSDLMQTVFVTLDGTNRIPIHIEADPTSDNFRYWPDEINMIAMQIQQGAGKTDAQWYKYLSERSYRTQIAELDYEQSVLENGGTVIDDEDGNRKMKMSDIRVLRKAYTDTYRFSMKQ